MCHILIRRWPHCCSASKAIKHDNQIYLYLEFLQRSSASRTFQRDYNHTVYLWIACFVALPAKHFSMTLLLEYICRISSYVSLLAEHLSLIFTSCVTSSTLIKHTFLCFKIYKTVSCFYLFNLEMNFTSDKAICSLINRKNIKYTTPCR